MVQKSLKYFVAKKRAMRQHSRPFFRHARGMTNAPDFRAAAAAKILGGLGG